MRNPLILVIHFHRAHDGFEERNRVLGSNALQPGDGVPHASPVRLCSGDWLDTHVHNRGPGHGERTLPLERESTFSGESLGHYPVALSGEVSGIMRCCPYTQSGKGSRENPVSLFSN